MGLVPYFVLQAWQHLDHHHLHLLNHRATPPSIRNWQLTGFRVRPDAVPSLTPKSTGACPTSSISRLFIGRIARSYNMTLAQEPVTTLVRQALLYTLESNLPTLASW